MVANTEYECITPDFLEMLEQIIIKKNAQIILQKEIRKSSLSADHINLSEQVLKAFGNVAEGRQSELLKLIQEFVEKSKHEPIIPFPTSKTEMKAAGIETYREFVERTRREEGKKCSDGKRCLEENWGKFLKACSPHLNRDYICQADLRKLDEKLMARLEQTYNTEELSKILPTRQLLNRQIAKAMTKKERSEIFRMNSIVKRCPSVS